MKAEELIREIAAALDSTAKIVEETDNYRLNQTENLSMRDTTCPDIFSYDGFVALEAA